MTEIFFSRFGKKILVIYINHSVSGVIVFVVEENIIFIKENILVVVENILFIKEKTPGVPENIPVTAEITRLILENDPNDEENLSPSEQFNFTVHMKSLKIVFISISTKKRIELLFFFTLLTIFCKMLWYGVRKQLRKSKILNANRKRRASLLKSIWNCLTPILFSAVFFALSAFSIPLNAQHFDFKTYNVEEGLSQSVVYDICQDRNGFLWIGTHGGGLNRYDGNKFVSFSMKDGLINNIVYSVIEARNGLLWIGTDNGLHKFDGNTFTVFSKRNGLAHNRIQVIREDIRGNLWMAHYSKGASVFDGKSFKNFNVSNGLIDNSVRTVLPDSRGNVWMGTLKGLSLYSGGRFRENKITNALSGYEIYSILEDRSKNLWFGTNHGVIHVKYLKNSGTVHEIRNHTADKKGDADIYVTYYTVKNGLIDDSVKFLLEDKRGRIWAATSKGVSMFDRHSFSSFTTQQGLCYNEVEKICEDSEGNLWFGTQSGISRFRGEMFSYFGIEDGLEDGTVWSIWQDHSGTIWLGTDYGISKYRGKGLPIITDTKAYAGKSPFGFFEDHSGNLWFGTGTEKKIIKFDGKSYTDLSPELGIVGFELFCITEDKKGNMWFGSRESGALKYDGKSTTYFTAQEGIIDNRINAIIEDHSGNIWFATKEGISILSNHDDPKRMRITNLTTEDGLSHKNIMCMVKDKEGNIWMGTYGGGITMYSPSGGKPGKKSLVSITSQDGLMDDNILLLIFENNNRLWIGSNKGISMLDTGQFKKNHSILIKNFGKDDGFFGIECNQSAAFKDKNGNLWFGTIKGAIRYNPHEDHPNYIQPSTHISGLKLFQEDVNWNSKFKPDEVTRVGKLPKNLKLEPSQNHLTFEYIGICLKVPEKVRYQVKLEGFDENWNPITRNTTATYSNLPPGKYTFMVRACNNSGIWNKIPETFSFQIKAPIWKEWWFLITLGITFIGLFYAYNRFRVKSLEKRQRYLEEQIQLRTLELQKEKTKVEEINYELEIRVLERTKKLADANKQLLEAQKMEVIGTLAGGVAHDLNNVMAGIISYPELLLMKLPEDSPLRKYAVTIKRSGEKAAAIVQDLLTLARRGISVCDVVNLNNVINEFLESPEFEKIMTYHPNVKVETHLSHELLNILGSPFHLSKAVMNLVSNAAEAMMEGGTLTITTHTEILDQPLPGYSEIVSGNYAVLSVIDNGTGISEDDLERIFEPFYTKKKMGKSGTGLGMTVVWGTVKDHNGYIVVQSEENKGTTFVLYFPATRRDIKEDKTKRSVFPEELRGNGESILVVDDVSEQREAAVLILEELGYCVHAVSQGEAAVDYVKQHAVDLLVLDMVMEPGIDGLETFKRCKDVNNQIKAVLISGYSETEESKKAQEIGAGAFIKKPFSLKSIGLAIKRELTKKTDGK